jgi:hypothetical protein
MSQKNADDVNGVGSGLGLYLCLGEWFWSRGASFLIRALSLHGLSGAFLLLGNEGAGTNADNDADNDSGEGAEEPARKPMSGLEFASASSLVESDDDTYEPTPVVIPVRRPLVALNQVAC